MRLALRFLPVCVPLACACTTLRPVQPDQLTSRHLPARVWVIRADQSVAVFDSAHVEGDSLVGMVNGKRGKRVPRARLQGRRPLRGELGRVDELHGTADA